MNIRRVLPIAATALAVVLAGCSDALIGAPASIDHGAVFDEVWHQFDLHYSFFEIKHINWDSLGAHYRPLAVAATTDQEFASVLSRMLAELKDVHVSLTPTGNQGTMRYLSPCDTTTTYFSTDIIANRYMRSSQLSPTGNLRFGMLTPTVGYLRISTFDGSGWASEVDAALDQMPGALRLVIDVRNNFGGRYAQAAEIAGRFTDHSRTFGYVRYRNGQSHSDFTSYADETVSPAGPRQFTGPVYVLTNRKDFSSAEDFIMAMSALPTTTIVGDTTAGASGGPIVRDLPNGWTYQLSEWIEYTRAHSTFEGTGLPPNVVVKATSANFLAGVDAALEQALALASR